MGPDYSANDRYNPLPSPIPQSRQRQLYRNELHNSYTALQIQAIVDPPGVIKMWATLSAPSGWVLCDGSAYKRDALPGLFAALGTTWSPSDNGTTFNVPDFRGRAPFGMDTNQSEFFNLGQAGGQKTVQAHSHGVDAGTNGYTGGIAGGLFFTNTPATHPGYTGLINTAGSGVNNLNPYRVVNFIIKT